MRCVSELWRKMKGRDSDVAVTVTVTSRASTMIWFIRERGRERD
jgi:hypothetical protein